MKPSTEIRDLMKRLYSAHERGDFPFFESHLSKDDEVIAIGSDPEEWWKGHAAISRVLEAQFREMGEVRMRASDDLAAFCDGNTGWASDHPTMTMPDGREFSPRITAVFSKQEGDWKIVAWHQSVGVLNEDLIGKRIKTS